MTRVIVRPLILSTKHATFNLYAIGDVHKGDIGFEEETYYEALEIIHADEEPKYIIWMGDYASHFPKKDYRRDDRTISRKYRSVLHTYSSIRDDIRPLVNKTLTILEGNHDNDWYREEEQDFVSWICTELNVPFSPFQPEDFSPYGTYESYIRLKIGARKTNSRRNLDIVAWHGGGAPRTKGGAVNVLERPAQAFPNADLFFMGHLHRHGIIPDSILGINEHDRTIIDKNRYFAFTGAFMRGYPEDASTYVSRRMLPPMGIGAVKLEIQPFYGKDERIKVKWEEIP